MSPEFCLRWNNHRPNLVNVFKELLHHEVLVDVTLAAEGQFIHAHRLVLSACSLYFKELFAVNPCQHPIVILKDFHIADLKTVVEFIYQGEVNVAQERLPNVLKTAESLRIKGLAENPRTFEDYQQQQQQQPQTSNSSATPRLGSQSSQQQSSSLSDSLDQQSVEGEEGPPASPHSPVPPPHKRKRVHAAYEHHDTTPALVPASVGSTEGVRVKEEPVSGNGHQRHSSAAASDAAQTGGSENESTNNRDSPSDKSVGGGGGGGGGGSPTPPPPLSLTPSLSNVSIAPGDSAAPALTPPDCSVPLGQQQGGADWTLPLTPWWASVLPVLARHHQEQQQQQQQQQQHSTLPNARAGFLQPPPAPTTPPKPILSNLPTMLNSDRLWPSSGRENSHSSSSSSSQWSHNTGGRGARITNTPPISLAGLDQVSLVTALGKEVSPQMVQALQAVATKRESFSSAAKLHCVSVTTLWRYFKKLNLQDPQKAIAIPTTTSTPPSFLN